MTKYFLLLIAFVFGGTSAVEAQMFDPIELEVKSIQTGELSYDLIFIAEIEPGWSTYSQKLSEEDQAMGPFPSSITYETTDLTFASPMAEECGGLETKYDAVFEMDLTKFFDRAVFIHSVKLSEPMDTPIEGFVTMMCCDETKCLPPTDYEFSIDLSQSIDGPDYDKKAVCEGKDMGQVESATETSDDIAVDGEAGEAEAEEAEAADEEEMSFSFGEGDDMGMEDPLQWQFDISEDGENYLFTAFAEVQEGWKVYGDHDHGFDGPIITKLFFDTLVGAETMGKGRLVSEEKKTAYDPFFALELTAVSGDFRLEQELSIQSSEPRVVGYAEFQACDSTQCLPPTIVPFIIDFDAMVAYNPETEERNFTTRGEGTPAYAQFDYSQARSDCLDDGNTTSEEDENSQSFFWIFFAGFLGGFVALLTPCVFPMIPLTVSFFTKSSKDRASGIRNALIYGFSIILIYVTLGLLVTSIFGADALNLLSTNAWFNIFFFVLFIVFALSFFGLFEITLPSSWANSADRAADKGGLIGIFFMAFTLSLVSFSCTGPIIGTLLVETATGGGGTIFGAIPAGPLVGMLGFSVALALPFGLFAAFPSWLNSLPQSGNWMNTVKVVLGFAEVALAFKFLSVADLTMGWKFLPYELFIAVWLLCAVGIAAYFFGWVKFPLDYTKPKMTKWRAGWGTLFLLIGAYIATGFTFSERDQAFVTPALLSGLAPPAGHSYIYPNECPLNLECIKDFQSGLEIAKARDLPILLDFTGHGCVNCRKMEDLVWGDEAVYDIIDKKYVLVSLYVDERTALDSSYVSSFDGRTKRTIGNKWSDFQSIHFKRNSQPYYVLMAPDGTILNKPVAYLPEVEKFKTFLQCGLEKFKQLN
jgi:thiol:disulfide interchange protein DsbD